MNSAVIQSVTVQLQDFIKSIVKTNNIDSYKVDVVPFSFEGNSYLSRNHFVDIKGKAGKETKEINLFVKFGLPTKDKSKTTHEIVESREIFLVEVYFYLELADIYRALQEEVKIPIEERLTFVKSFGVTDKVIILENAIRNGFKAYDVMHTVDLKMAQQCIKELAKFHGLSYALKRSRPEYYAEKIQSMRSLFILDDYWRKFLAKVCKNTLKVVNDKTKNMIEDYYLPQILKNGPALVEPPGLESDCLCHGDFRANGNILSKDINGENLQIIAIDYQILHYGCPASDLLYFIITSTDHTFRRQYWDQLKQHYIDSLKLFLKYFNIDSDTILTMAKLEHLLKKKILYSMMMTLTGTAYTYNLNPGVDFGDVNNCIFEMKPGFRERIQGSFDDLISWDN